MTHTTHLLQSAFLHVIFTVTLPAGANSYVIMFSGIVVPKHLNIYIQVILFLLFLLYITVGTFY